jgi:hypothetical protein
VLVVRLFILLLTVKVIRYCEGRACRRKTVLAHFGEQVYIHDPYRSSFNEVVFWVFKYIFKMELIIVLKENLGFVSCYDLNKNVLI